MDVTTLSRIQFGITASFHFIFPPLSIGLGVFLVILEGIYLKTKNVRYREMTKFWGKIFAVTFALGVATGLVQVFAFGNNWSRYSSFVGDVFGSALGAEGIFAFFLESGFLGIMLFGWERVSRGVHYVSTICVCLGAHFSAIWIIVANSWMQTPAGYKIVMEGARPRAVVTDFWEMILNPSTIDRLTHTIIACWLTGAFLVLSISAYYLLKKRHRDLAFTSMRIGLGIALVSLILQLISADSSARGVAKYQPEKLAAMEGLYQTEQKTPMTLIGYVSGKKEKTFGIKVPSLLSFLIYRDAVTPVPGLKQFPKEDWPNAPVVFQTYHLMIYMWILMVIATVLAIIFLKKKKLEKAKWTLRLLVASVVFPQIANQAGWGTAEMGRQPWIVYKLLRTPQGVSPSIIPAYVIGSILMFIVIYSLLFFLFLYLLNRKVQHGIEGEPFPEKDDQIYRNIYDS